MLPNNHNINNNNKVIKLKKKDSTFNFDEDEEEEKEENDQISYDYNNYSNYSNYNNYGNDNMNYSINNTNNNNNNSNYSSQRNSIINDSVTIKDKYDSQDSGVLDIRLGDNKFHMNNSINHSINMGKLNNNINNSLNNSIINKSINLDVNNSFKNKENSNEYESHKTNNSNKPYNSKKDRSYTSNASIKTEKSKKSLKSKAVDISGISSNLQNDNSNINLINNTSNNNINLINNTSNNNINNVSKNSHIYNNITNIKNNNEYENEDNANELENKRESDFYKLKIKKFQNYNRRNNKEKTELFKNPNLSKNQKEEIRRVVKFNTIVKGLNTDSQGSKKIKNDNVGNSTNKEKISSSKSISRVNENKKPQDAYYQIINTEDDTNNHPNDLLSDEVDVSMLILDEFKYTCTGFNNNNLNTCGVINNKNSSNSILNLKNNSNYRAIVKNKARSSSSIISEVSKKNNYNKTCTNYNNNTNTSNLRNTTQLPVSLHSNKAYIFFNSIETDFKQLGLNSLSDISEYFTNIFSNAKLFPYLSVSSKTPSDGNPSNNIVKEQKLFKNERLFINEANESSICNDNENEGDMQADINNYDIKKIVNTQSQYNSAEDSFANNQENVESRLNSRSHKDNTNDKSSDDKLSNYKNNNNNEFNSNETFSKHSNKSSNYNTEESNANSNIGVDDILLIQNKTLFKKMILPDLVNKNKFYNEYIIFRVLERFRPKLIKSIVNMKDLGKSNKKNSIVAKKESIDYNLNDINNHNNNENNKNINIEMSNIKNKSDIYDNSNINLKNSSSRSYINNQNNIDNSNNNNNNNNNNNAKIIIEEPQSLNNMNIGKDQPLSLEEQQSKINESILNNNNYNHFISISKLIQQKITEIIFDYAIITKEKQQIKEDKKKEKEKNKTINDEDFYLNNIEEDIENETRKLELRSEGASLQPAKLASFNIDNLLLKICLYNTYNLPINLIYFKWKTYFMNMITNWKNESQSLVKHKYKLNYLLLKQLIIKLMENKKRDLLSNNFIYKKKSALITNQINNNEGVLIKVSENEESDSKDLAEFSFLPYSLPIIFFQMLIDIQCVYFLIMCPIVFSTGQINNTIFTFDKFFHLIYFINVLKNFRTLQYTEENVLIKSMIEICWKTLLKFQFWLDIISLIPFVVFSSDVNDNYTNSWFFYFYILPLLRVSSFGSTITMLEKTRYVFYVRLLVLISKFIIFAHWIGFLFFKYENFDVISNEDIAISDTCIKISQGEKKLSNSCYAVLAEYYGSYVIPGQFFNGLTLMDELSEYNTDYSFLYMMYFVGLIITAYIFGGVNDLIRNMNQANNIYNQKLDKAKGLMLFYNFDKNKFLEVNQFYENLWQKQRQIIYGEELFSNLPQSLRNKILEKVDPHIKYIMKDLYSIAVPFRIKKYYNCLHENMNAYIAAPYERLYVKGELVKGLFILRNGKLTFSQLKTELRNYIEEEENNNSIDKKEIDQSIINKDDKNKSNSNANANNNNNNVNYNINNYKNTTNLAETNNKEKEKLKEKKKKEVESTFSDLNYNIQILREQMKKQIQDLEEESSAFKMNSNENSMFPLDSIFFKTGRAAETCFTDDFCELFLINLKIFDEILFLDFPIEMESLKQKAMVIGKDKIGRNKMTKDVVMKHSSRSIGEYYEKEYDNENIWIDIMRKIPFINRTLDRHTNLFQGLSSGLGDMSHNLINVIFQTQIIKNMEKKDEMQFKDRAYS